MTGVLASRLVRPWVRAHLPARTIRLRLTLVYGSLFLLSGAALLAITYVLARHAYTEDFFISSGNGGIAKVLLTQNTVHVKGGGTIVGPAAPLGGLLVGPQKKVVAAAASAQSGAALHLLLVDSGIALAIMAGISIWLGWMISGRALRPLRTITNAAREISASNLHRRLALEGPDDELMQLGTTFDGLLERLEASFEAQRQFVANASHELRTPLTLERTLLEVALGDPEPSVESLQRTCRQVLAVGEQQERLIEALLTLSRSQRGLDRREPVDLAAIVEAASAAVDQNGLAFATTLEPAHTSGDRRLAERLVANLLGNAVHHNVAGGSVTVETETRRGEAILRVANTGPAVPPGDVSRIFEPFQRVNIDRTQHVNGLGLGLSIVGAIAKAHGARITTLAPAGGGLQVEVGFPASASPRS